jgi:hypothetical protein
MSFVTIKHVMPLYPFEGSLSKTVRIKNTGEPSMTYTLANTRKMSASPELVIHIFEPFNT